MIISVQNLSNDIFYSVNSKVASEKYYHENFIQSFRYAFKVVVFIIKFEPTGEFNFENRHVIKLL